MKNTHLTYALIIGLVLASFAFISASSAPAEEKKEVLMLEINKYGIYVFESEKPGEFTKLSPLLRQRDLENNGQLIQAKLQELYAQGWKLEEACASDMLQRFVLVR